MKITARIAWLSLIVFQVLSFPVRGPWAAEKAAKLSPAGIAYVSRSTLDMPFMIARDRGFFREEGWKSNLFL